MGAWDRAGIGSGLGIWELGRGGLLERAWVVEGRRDFALEFGSGGEGIELLGIVGSWVNEASFGELVVFESLSKIFDLILSLLKGLTFEECKSSREFSSCLADR